MWGTSGCSMSNCQTATASLPSTKISKPSSPVVSGLGFGVWGLDLEAVLACGGGEHVGTFRGSGFGVRVSGFGVRVSGFGFGLRSYGGSKEVARARTHPGFYRALGSQSMRGRGEKGQKKTSNLCNRSERRSSPCLLPSWWRQLQSPYS